MSEFRRDTMTDLGETFSYEQMLFFSINSLFCLETGVDYLGDFVCIRIVMFEVAHILWAIHWIHNNL